ncbi:class I SAM-dependent DNA methyltransferase [Moraxella osloensis]|nr:class I SAM-dependent DNA methyltransferase [Moraxella osloensis]
MDSVERREMGAHYTEAVNILKVVNGLFMMELREEFATAVGHLNNPSIAKDRRADLLNALHEKISNLTFLDPACGCGNFLVVAYRELRLLELDILDVLYPKDQHGLFDISGMIKCHIGQFYGIELDEYSTHIARVAMWLTDHQMNMLCAERLGQTRPTVPLTESATIINANSLHTDWQVTDYILGNPPFVGQSWRSEQQQADVKAIMPSDGKFGKLDYVACWHIKASRMMTANPTTKTAFVSTNSICQGEQAGVLWGYLFEQGFEINFAHRTFQWTSQASGKAAVHCIIVGFSLVANENKSLFDYPDIKGEPVLTVADNINQYLVNAPSVILPSRSKPPVGMTAMTKGSQPTDGGNLILSVSEKAELINKYPKLASFIKPFIGAEELINGKERYCLWFNGANIKDRSEFIKYPEIKQRIDNIKTLRANSPTKSVQEQANEPWVFTQIRQPKGDYIAVPEVSSETRAYIPMDLFNKDIIASNKIYMIPNADLYLFGVLISEMHMDWMRTVAGRLKSDYSYSPNVYHAFPFPTVNDNDKKNIATLAQKVLDERAKQLVDGVSLAMLYNVDTMPTNLKKAHRALDKAVEKIYDPNGFKSDCERVGFLFERYNQLHA